MQGFYESNYKYYLDTITNFLLLNTFMLLCSIPIITIPPAIAAIFDVTYSWGKQEGSGSVLVQYAKAFKKQIVRSYLFVIGSGFIILSLYMYYVLMINNLLNGVPLIVLGGLAIAISVLVILASVYFFSLNSALTTSFLQSIKLSLFFSILHVKLTIMLVLLWALMILFLVVYPVTVLLGIVPALAFWQNIWVRSKLTRLPVTSQI